MASGNTVASDVVVKNVLAYGNNQAHKIELYDVPSVPGYKPAGVIGFSPGGGWNPGDYVCRLLIYNSQLSVAWSEAVPTNQYLDCTILYIKE